ncbi:MAG TPA: SDR family oxidoreductase [Acidimicrobiales bacterium]|nr:SDR family oxidoreductase [Acidimicrobiales bacterium]
MPVAIITGGSRGFGRALAEDLLSAGWAVVVDARRGPFPPTAHAIEGDVTDATHRAALIDTARRLGGLDLLVNNASALGPSPLPRLADHPVPDLRRVLEVNVVAPLALTQETLPLLRASGGAVVNVTSDAAVEGYEGWGGYGASKAALDQLSNVLAAEEPSVRVWAFDPGDMRTQMHQHAFPGEDISDRPEPATVVPAVRRLLTERPPSGRVRAQDLLAVTR